MKFKICKSQLIKFLKEEMHMSYKILHPITLNHNKEENKLQRQYAASLFIDYMFQGKRIINVDESSLSHTDHRKRGWVHYGIKNTITHTQRLYQVNLIAGVSNFGECFYCVNKGKTNSLTFLYFITKLVVHLQSIDKDWRENTIIMIDNAPYHRSSKLREQLIKLKIPIMFMGPYQYKLAPVENFFSFIKCRDLNPINKQGFSRMKTSINLKEIALHISRNDFQWLKSCFFNALTNALEFLTLKNL